MRTRDHLAKDLIVRALDDELSGAETVRVESHLRECQECRRAYEELRSFSSRIESLIMGAWLENTAPTAGEREGLAAQLETATALKSKPRNSEQVLRRFGWGMAIAAMLAIGVLVLHSRRPETLNRAVSNGSSQQTLLVDGETFIRLPYSNPDLPVNGSQVVQMQLPASTLADAGVVFEPVSSTVLERDTSVTADVLLGIDGQPLGVHVVEAD